MLELYVDMYIKRLQEDCFFFFCCFIIGICFIMFLLLSVHVVCLAELNERCLVPKVVSKGQTYGEA